VKRRGGGAAVAAGREKKINFFLNNLFFNYEISAGG
jgi:hypothetical protein